MTIATIHQPQYLPYLGFFHKVAHADVLVVLDDVQFLKRGFQHRNRIKTPQGWQWITVPVSPGSRQLLPDVRVSGGEDWAAKHEKAITLNYARAPHFAELSAGVFEVLHRPHDRLVELDLALMRWALDLLGIEVEVVRSSAYAVETAKSERLTDLCRAVRAETYLSGEGARSYMDLDVFARAGVEVRWQAFDPPAYEQLFPAQGFVPDLAIVDTLFCCGAERVARWCRGDVV
jgi:hypothetical protein